MRKIIIDAGHGFNTPGKRTPNGEREWTFNDKVARAVVRKLNEYSGVQILRVDDQTGKMDIPLKTRTDRANNWKADVYISIHHNALRGVWGNHGGVECYTLDHPSVSPKSRQIAAIIHPRIVQAMGLRDRGLKTRNLHVLRETHMPAILTEGGFMDSTIDIRTMQNDSKLIAQGNSIAEGLAIYFKLQTKVASEDVSMWEKRDGLLKLSQWQKDEVIKIYKHARGKGVFSSAEHETDIKDGKMTVDKAIFLSTMIAGSTLNGGNRIK